MSLLSVSISWSVFASNYLGCCDLFVPKSVLHQQEASATVTTWGPWCGPSFSMRLPFKARVGSTQFATELMPPTLSHRGPRLQCHSQASPISVVLWLIPRARLLPPGNHHHGGCGHTARVPRFLGSTEVTEPQLAALLPTSACSISIEIRLIDFDLAALAGSSSPWRLCASAGVHCGGAV